MAERTVLVCDRDDAEPATRYTITIEGVTRHLDLCDACTEALHLPELAALLKNFGAPIPKNWARPKASRLATLLAEMTRSRDEAAPSPAVPASAGDPADGSGSASDASPHPAAKKAVAARKAPPRKTAAKSAVKAPTKKTASPRASTAT